MTSHFPNVTRREFAALALWPAFRRRKRFSLAGIRFDLVRQSGTPWRFLHVHGDETTARDVLREALPQLGGQAMFVRNATRMVIVNGMRLDPNRMFSRAGAERSLQRANTGASKAEMEAVLARLDRDREAFLTALLPPPGGLLVSLHNNSQGYSMDAETADSEKVARNEPSAPRDFFLATTAADYEALAQAPFNAVLQTQPEPDDGSLSRLCARRGIRYVNIEAALGSKEKQAAMLRVVGNALLKK